MKQFSAPVSSETAPTSKEDVISIIQILAILRRRKRLILVIAGAMTFIGLCYAIFARPLYTASIVVQPLTSSTGGSLSQMAGTTVGAAAALAGINLSSDDPAKSEHLAILKSREFGIDFLKTYDVLPHLFPKKWNAKKQAWNEPNRNGLIAKIRLGISNMLAYLSDDQGHQRRGAKPTSWQAFKRLKEIRKVEEDSDSGMVTVSFEFRDPDLAASWANSYIALANKEIRKRAVDESNRALDFLNKELEKTSISGLRDTIYSVVERQIENITLANATPEYAFRIVDPAVTPEDRSFPNRLLIIILSLFAGLALGAFVALWLELVSLK